MDTPSVKKMQFSYFDKLNAFKFNQIGKNIIRFSKTFIINQFKDINANIIHCKFGQT